MIQLVNLIRNKRSNILQNYSILDEFGRNVFVLLKLNGRVLLLLLQFPVVVLGKGYLEHGFQVSCSNPLKYFAVVVMIVSLIGVFVRDYGTRICRQH